MKSEKNKIKFIILLFTVCIAYSSCAKNENTQKTDDDKKEELSIQKETRPKFKRAFYENMGTVGLPNNFEDAQKLNYKIKKILIN